MRRAAHGGYRYASQTASVPAPVRGWNARDSIASMRPDEAVRLDNWFPDTSNIVMRKGSLTQTAEVGGRVETLVVYRPMSGSHEMWAFAGGSLFNVSAGGTSPAATVTGLSNARWQHQNVTTTGGNFVIAVNGLDDMLLYNGTAWASIDSASTPAITGVNTSDLIAVHSHKARVYYIEKASLSVWYAAVGAFAGALTEFNLGSIFTRGGHLMAMGTWSIDGGSGLDDYAVFITSEGEVAVYQGTNPAQADSWALVGVYQIGRPIGRRCTIKFGGDLLIITEDGVVPASRAFITAQTDRTVAITDQIQGAMAQAASLYGAQNGWDLTLYPSASMLILNVPVADGSHQYVMNTITRRWCRFTGWDAECFAVFNGNLYYGGNGKVVRAWFGSSDDGAPIVSDLVQAFNYFRKNTQQKIFRLVRPIMAWDANPAEILMGMDVDFVVKEPVGAVAFAGGVGDTWDGEGVNWDEATWGGGLSLNKNWYTVTGVGYAGAPHLMVSSTSAEVRLSAFDVVYEAGGIL